MDSWSPRVFSLLRIVAGLLFLEHGLQKIFHFPPPLPPAPTMAAAATHVAAKMAPHGAPWFVPIAGWIEIVGGVLITLGLFGRFAAFICSGEMAFAYFMAHASKSFYPVNNGGGEAILYCFLFLFIAFAGSGSISIDALMKKKI
jgi:putative oxidoreductase